MKETKRRRVYNAVVELLGPLWQDSGQWGEDRLYARCGEGPGEAESAQYRRFAHLSAARGSCKACSLHCGNAWTQSARAFGSQNVEGMGERALCGRSSGATRSTGRCSLRCMPTRVVWARAIGGSVCCACAHDAASLLPLFNWFPDLFGAVGMELQMCR